jgi:hydroxypyruvate isomerase
MQLSLCLEMLFTDRPFIERMKIASELGYRAVEFWDWRDKDLAAIAQTAAERDLAIAAMSGNRRHSLIDPAEREGLIEEMMQVFGAAQRLHCRHVMMLSDVLEADGSAAPARSLSDEEKVASIADGLRELAGWARNSGVALLLEPLNTALDHRGCFLDSSELGVRILQHVNSPQVQLLYDIYHMTMMGEDALAEIGKHKSWIGYVHVADKPGRHQPGTGDIDYCAVSELLKRIGYKGFIGMEFSAHGSDEEAARAPLEVFV